MKPNDPELWGPGAWRVLHSLASSASGPVMATVLRSLVPAIPCPSCAQHLAHMLDAHDPAHAPPALYLFWLHNVVNARLGKRLLLLPPRPPFSPGSRRFAADLERLLQQMRDAGRDPRAIRVFAAAVSSARAWSLSKRSRRP